MDSAKLTAWSCTIFCAYVAGEEPENDGWVLDFGEWASIYRTCLTRRAEYRNEADRLVQTVGNGRCLSSLVRVAV